MNYHPGRGDSWHSGTVRPQNGAACAYNKDINQRQAMTNLLQKIQSEIDELHKKFDVLQSQSATTSELNSVRRKLNIAYEKLRKNSND